MINFVELFKLIPSELATILIAMIPVGENRAAVPIAMNIYDMSMVVAIFWASVGSVALAAILLYGFRVVHRLVYGRLSWLDMIVDWFFARTRRKFMKKYEYWGEVALLLFVAIPLPVTGIWTGSIAAFLFDIRPRRALFFISVGAVISAIIVGLITSGFIKFF